jgi:cell division protein FtsL
MNEANSELQKPAEEGAGKPTPTPEKASKGAAPVKKESAAARFFRRVLRWTLGILIVFGLGVISALYLWYLPLRQANISLNKDLLAANEQITQLKQQVADQTVQQNKAQQEIDQLKLADYQSQIKSAQLEVANARIALYQNDPNQALSALEKVTSMLTSLQLKLPQDQQTRIADLQARLDLAKKEVKDNTYAAQSDLDVLAQGLSSLSGMLVSP